LTPFALILLVVAATSVVQSLFGVGVLLFGTPWLLLAGLDFVTTLQYLLPVSLTISVLQVAGDIKWVERALIRRLVLLTLPAIAITLWLTAASQVRLEIFVAAIVVAIALQNRVRPIERGVAALLVRERTYMVFMGAVHGASNLGGGLLTGWVFSKGLHGRVARGTVATGYGLFAAAQLVTLAVSPSEWSVAARENLILTVTGATVFVLTDRLLFERFRPKHYRLGLEVLLLATGLLLVLKVVL